MALGIKILSTVMSLLIVSITEITPWVFSNENATEHSVILDAACFDSVHSIPAATLIVFERNEVASDAPSQEVCEPVTEILTEETTFVFEEAVTQPEETTVTLSETVSTETATEETTLEETEPSTKAPKPVSPSKKGGTMLWPVASDSTVVSGFPYYENGGAHHGVDIFVIGADGRTRDDNGNSLSYGKKFRAAREGVVIEARNDGEWNTGYGNYCIVDHGDGTLTLYAHAKTVCVKPGEKVVLGQTLGEIGGTGNATAPHLHFEVRIGGAGSLTRVDPMDYISEP